MAVSNPNPLPIAQGGTGVKSALAAVLAILGPQTLGPNGSIQIGEALFQWGNFISSAGVDDVINYPTPFTECYGVLGTTRANFGSDMNFQLSGAPGLNSFQCSVSNAGTRPGGVIAYWFAVGKKVAA